MFVIPELIDPKIRAFYRRQERVDNGEARIDEAKARENVRPLGNVMLVWERRSGLVKRGGTAEPVHPRPTGG